MITNDQFKRIVQAYLGGRSCGEIREQFLAEGMTEYQIYLNVKAAQIIRKEQIQRPATPGSEFKTVRFKAVKVQG